MARWWSSAGRKQERERGVVCARGGWEICVCSCESAVLSAEDLFLPENDGGCGSYDTARLMRVSHKSCFAKATQDKGRK